MNKRVLILLSILLIITIVGVAVGVFLSRQTQQVQNQAWQTSQSVLATCAPDGNVAISATFSNTEPENTPADDMNVRVTDLQTGKSADFGVIKGGETKTTTIETSQSALSAGSVRFDLTWADGRDGTDTRTADYSAVATCLAPTPTPTIAPTPTPDITPTPTPVPTANPSPTPTSTPAVACNSECTTNAQCPSDLICSSGRCRRPGCTALDSCTCGPSCNSSCTTNTDCPSDLICASGKCRRPGCTSLDSCSCGPTVTPTPTLPPTLPVSGSVGTTVVSGVAGIVLLILGVAAFAR